MKTSSNDRGSSRVDPGRDDQARLREVLDLLRERFPHINGLSLRLLERDETFRELCEEYVVCTEVVERLTRSGSDEAMRREYSALRLRVERELLDYISGNAAGVGGHR
jgi:hypothetical protein